MDKILRGSPFLLVFLLFLLSGCARQGSAPEIFDVSCLNYLGQPPETVFRELGGSQEDWETGGAGVRWRRKEPMELLGRSFTVNLDFDPTENTLGDFSYLLHLEEPNETDGKYLRELAEAATQQFGEPVTYPGVQERIVTLEDSSDLSKLLSNRYFDCWALPDFPRQLLKIESYPVNGNSELIIEITTMARLEENP